MSTIPFWGTFAANLLGCLALSLATIATLELDLSVWYAICFLLHSAHLNTGIVCVMSSLIPSFESMLVFLHICCSLTKKIYIHIYSPSSIGKVLSCLASVLASVVRIRVLPYLCTS